MVAHLPRNQAMAVRFCPGALIIDCWHLLKVGLGNLPGFLNYPRQRSILPLGLDSDLLQHIFWKVQALLTLI